MKKIILLLLCIPLSGCALYDAYFTAKFDNNEYEKLNKIRTISMLSTGDCTNTNISGLNFYSLYEQSLELYNYTQYIPNNEDTIKMTNGLVQLSKQALDVYDKGNVVSESFCKLKLQQINRSSETIQKVVGSKPR